MKYKLGERVRVVGWLPGFSPPFTEGVISEIKEMIHNGSLVMGYMINDIGVLEEWLAPWEEQPQEPTNCICDTKSVLMVCGCKCGWIEKERAARISG